MTGPAQRAPTLYGIIVIKLLKGTLFVILACVLYAYSDNDLPLEYHNLLHLLHLNPEGMFWSRLAVRVGAITESNLLWLAAGTFIYSLFSLVEGVGLLFRVSWASWMAIGESAFFIPIEIYKLTHRYSFVVVFILVLNLFIFWYLLLNRKRLFHHAQIHFPKTVSSTA